MSVAEWSGGDRSEHDFEPVAKKEQNGWSSLESSPREAFPRVVPSQSDPSSSDENHRVRERTVRACPCAP